jgi:hypothetical protein
MFVISHRAGFFCVYDSLLDQCFSTAWLRPGTGPWTQLYWATTPQKLRTTALDIANELKDRYFMRLPRSCLV